MIRQETYFQGTDIVLYIAKALIQHENSFEAQRIDNHAPKTRFQRKNVSPYSTTCYDIKHQRSLDIQ